MKPYPCLYTSLYLILVVGGEEIGEFVGYLFEDRDAREVDDAEVIRLRPVEAAAGDDEDALLLQEVQRELVIVRDVELCGIDFWKDVEGGLRLLHGDAGDAVEGITDAVALLIDAAAGHGILIDALVAPESRLDNGLALDVGAQAHVGEHIHAIDIVPADFLVAAEDHPADAEAAHHVGLGEAVEGDAEEIRREGGDGDMLLPVHHHAVMHLIGKDHEAVAAGNLHNLLQDLFRVEGTGRVIRVDDDNSFGARGDF